MPYHPKETPGVATWLCSQSAFASVNSLRSLEQSPKDDLEALAYVLIYLVSGSLPWDTTKMDREAVSRMKENVNVYTIFSPGVPSVFVDFLKQIRQLGYMEHPKYDSYIATFAAFATKLKETRPLLPQFEQFNH
jgi:hypothetical protein